MTTQMTLDTGRATGTLAIAASGLSKSFGDTRAVDGVSVAVEPGQFVALLGPSGSGKTTLLRMIAGFDAQDAGTVRISGRLVAGDGIWEEPDRRHVGMVFQEGALFPHLPVAANVGFGGPREGRVEECLELVGLAHRARSYPHELSGGERQRIALARALANEPDVVLLDEPFASLDAALRGTLREEVAAILRKAGASALMVTHDQQEALSLADEVVVMRGGRVEQTGPPEVIYTRPATRWVAEFVGEADLLPGTAGDGVVTCELGRFPTEDSSEGPVDVVVRPESVAVAAANGDGGTAHPVGPGSLDSVADARVIGRTYYGHDQLLRLELASGVQLRSRMLGSVAWRPGDHVKVWVEGPVSVLSRPSQ